MNLLECRQKAIDEGAFDSAEFDLVNSRGLRSRCKWEDAHFGVFKVLDRPAHLVGQLLHANVFKGEDGLTVENFSATGRATRVQMKILTKYNAEGLIAELSQRIREKGHDGLLLSSLDAVDAYLAGGLTLKGDVKLVTRSSGQFLVWLSPPAEKPPVFSEE